MARTDPAYLFHIPEVLKKALHKEATRAKLSLAAYLLHLIETHPERAAKARK
jgi:plasmid stability protein